MTIRVRRIHDCAETEGAYCILVDRDWPPGLSRERAQLDEWIRVLAPSDWLARRFGRNPGRWGTFRSRYRRQLRSKKRRAALARIARISRRRDVLLLHADPDRARNLATVIAEILEKDFSLPVGS